MKVKDLLDRLKDFNPDSEIMVLDGFNGSGNPREINLGPVERQIKESDEQATADCEGKQRQWVVIMGFGCY